jgi:hypothetical protein
MTVKFNWQIDSLDVAVSEQDMSNVVKAVHWRCVATDESYKAETYGCATLPSPTPDEFVSFDSLTEQKVLNWAKSYVGGESVENDLSSKIDAQRSPSIVSLTPPWIEVGV